MWIGVGGTIVFSICAFCEMWNLFGVTLFYKCVVNWSFRVDICSVYVHSAIYESYLVQCYSLHLFSIGVGQYIYSQYMCIMLYMKVIWFNAISYIYFQLEWGYMYPHYMCIVLYVIVIWCNDIAEIYCQFGRVDVSSVYVHSDIS